MCFLKVCMACFMEIYKYEQNLYMIKKILREELHFKERLKPVTGTNALIYVTKFNRKS